MVKTDMALTELYWCALREHFIQNDPDRGVRPSFCAQLLFTLPDPSCVIASAGSECKDGKGRILGTLRGKASSIGHIEPTSLPALIVRIKY
jgi:hypothetical protein